MSGQQAAADESAAAVFDEEFVEGEMAAAVNQSVRWHLTQVYHLSTRPWHTWRVQAEFRCLFLSSGPVCLAYLAQLSTIPAASQPDSRRNQWNGTVLP